MKHLWKKLFSKQDIKTQVELHSAGATVRHINPFVDLEVPRNSDKLNKEFIDKWVNPHLTFGFSNLPLTQEEAYIKSYPGITTETVKSLLGDFNWRTRIVGAYFTALKDFNEFEETIGNHLLRSEVCYAGSGYCLALANFGTEKSKNYLKRYLDYYLPKKDLWFDQDVALSALSLLDENEAENYKDLWNEFVINKQNWDLEKSIKAFAKEMETLNKVKQIAKEKG